jgi:hypothetical protein
VGFYKKYISISNTIDALNNNRLNDLYSKCDVLIFESDNSVLIFNMFQSGKSETEILSLIKNMNYEMYKINQTN